MADEPVSKGMADLITMYNAAQDTAYVEAMKANDKDAARTALEDMEAMNWPANPWWKSVSRGCAAHHGAMGDRELAGRRPRGVPATRRQIR